MRTDMTNDRFCIVISGPFCNLRWFPFANLEMQQAAALGQHIHASPGGPQEWIGRVVKSIGGMLAFRDESEPDVFGWAAINDVFSRRWRQAVSQQDARRQIHLRSIMNVSIDGKSNVTEPDAGMAGDGDATNREARLFKSVVKGFFADRRKVQRVEEAASSEGAVAQQASPFQVATPEAIATIAGALKRIADHFDPPPPDVVDSVYIRQKLGCTTQWIADMARNGVIPVACIVPGTGKGKPWKFYRSKIEKWLEER